MDIENLSAFENGREYIQLHAVLMSSGSLDEMAWHEMKKKVDWRGSRCWGIEAAHKEE
jgi:hypothetical protein